MLLRLEISEIVASLFEVAIFLMAVWLVWDLQVEFGKKLIVVTAFSFRLVMLIVTVFRLESFDKAGFTVDATQREVSYICWTQTELNYSIISATIIIGRQFVGVLVTSYSSGHGLSGSYTRSGGATHGASFQMSTLNSRWRENRVKADSKDHRDLSLYSETREGGMYSSGAAACNAANAQSVASTNFQSTDSTRVGSNESQKMIITKDITWQIQRDSTDLKPTCCSSAVL